MATRATYNLYVLIKWIADTGKSYDMNTYSKQKIKLREDGHIFTFDEHVEALIWALLSQQRPWYVIEQNKEKIREIFNNFDSDYISRTDPSILCSKICDIKCGNRRISYQMSELQWNIDILHRIDEEYGSLHEFDVKYPVYDVAKRLCSGYDKLYGIGPALALEYLKNVGVDCVKPDVHIIRILQRFGYNINNEWDACSVIQKVSDETDYYMSDIGYVFWRFCATGYMEICSAHPKCEVCPITHCKYRDSSL